MEKKKNIIAPAAFIVASLFLFNPNVNIVDLLPDFIGYIILYTSLSKVADLVPHFDEARDRFHKLFWITLSKIPAMFIMLSISSQYTAEKPIIAVFSLTYAIIELIYIYPAFNSFYDGLEYLEERFGTDDGKPLHLPPRKFTAVFFSIKMLGCTLPEFTLTSVSDILGDVTYKPNIATFYPLLSAFSAIIVFGFGIVFLVKFIKFINCVSISKPIEFSLSSSYLEKRERLAQIYSFRFVCLSMSLLTFATLFGADLFIDNKNMLPDIFSALLFLASAGVMRRFSSRAKLPIILSIFYAFSSLCTTFAQSNFVNNYDYMDILKITAAKRCYDLVIASSAIEFLFLSLTLLSFAYCLSDAVKKMTGSPNANESAQKYNNELHRSFKVQSFIMAIFGMIASASTVVYIYLLSYTERVAVLPEYSDVEVTMQKYGEFWIVVAILCIVWLVYTYRLAHAVKEAAEAKFEIEN